MPSVYIKKKEGLYYDAKTGRTMEHQGYATRIYWSTAMLDYLRRHFPTTKTTNWQDVWACRSAR
jgi:hypothetical protein